MKCRYSSIYIAAISLLALFPAILPAQDLKDDPRVSDAIYLLDRWIDAQRDYEQIPGISIGVVYDQEVIWSKGFGYADLEGNQPATEHTIYSTCSISKLFTSVGAMQLRDKGLLRLDDPVDTILPWFQLKNRDPETPLITLRNLLTHSSGLPNGAGFDEMYPFEHPSRDDIIERIPELETLFPAWQVENYSNLGMILAGDMIEEQSGQAYGDYITENIFEPLGMTRSTPEIENLRGMDDFAIGYSFVHRNGKRLRVGPFEARGIAPAYGSASTVEDLAKFASWMLRVVESAEFEVLDGNTLREMQRVQFLDPAGETTWGLGFDISKSGGNTFVGHAGFCPGYQSRLHVEMGEKIATIILANTMLPIWRYTNQAYNIVAPAIKSARDNPEGGKTLPAEFAKYIGRYDSHPFGGELQIVPRNGELAVVRFPADTQLRVRTLKHIEGDTFQQLRNGQRLGEKYVFETDAEGDVIRMVIDGNTFPRMN